MKRALALWLCASACGPIEGDADAAVRGRGSAVVGGDVVATVDGAPITIVEVERAASAAGVSPEVALRRLEDELLLARAAEAAGFGDDPEVRAAVRRAMVQELLAREVEAGTEIDEAALAAAYAAEPERYARPERRRSLHVLAAAEGGEAAERWIRDVHARASAADDPAAVLLALRRRPPGEPAFEVVIEEVEPIAEDTGADPAYTRALFGPAEPGLVPDVVRSELGWHVVHLSEIEPAERPTPAEAMERLRAEHVARARTRRLGVLIGRIAERTPVVPDQAGVRALSDPALTGGR